MPAAHPRGAVMTMKKLIAAAAAGALAVGGIALAPPALACTASDDVNILCSNEQAFVDELAGVGIKPKDNARRSVNLAWRICGELASGTGYDVEVQKVYRDNSLHLNEAQAIVAAAVRHLCTY
jgi:Protein of unknown function (DUF732)